MMDRAGDIIFVSSFVISLPRSNTIELPFSRLAFETLFT